jgi:hypothetical protein
MLLLSPHRNLCIHAPPTGMEPRLPLFPGQAAVLRPKQLSVGQCRFERGKQQDPAELMLLLATGMRADMGVPSLFEGCNFFMGSNCVGPGDITVSGLVPPPPSVIVPAAVPCVSFACLEDCRLPACVNVASAGLRRTESIDFSICQYNHNMEMLHEGPFPMANIQKMHSAEMSSGGL